MNISEIIDQFNESLEKIYEERGISNDTINLYLRVTNDFKMFILNKEILKINEQCIIDYIELKTHIRIKTIYQTISNSKINRYLRPLNMLYIYIKTGVLDLSSRKIKQNMNCPPQFEYLYHVFISHCQNSGLSSATVHTNKYHCLLFLNYLSKKNIKSINDMHYSDIDEYLRSIQKYSIKHRGTILYVLKKFLICLFESDLICKNYALLMPSIHVPRNGRIPHSWTKEEIQKILDSVDREDPAGKRDYAMILMTAKLGLRVGDIRNLRLHNIDWENKKISIIISKTKQILELPLLEDIGWAIIDYLKNGRPKTDSDRLFVRHKAPFTAFGDTSNFSKLLIKYIRKAGINIEDNHPHGFHSLRNALAKNMLESGAPLPVISETLGHTNINTTSIYLKIDLKGLRKCMIDPEEVFQT